MRKDVFKWKMSAEMHQSSVYALREEIREHWSNQKPMNIGLIIDLLPLQTDDSELINERGEVAFNGDDFENIGDESTIEFYDQVIGTYYATIDEKWSGKIKIDTDTIEIEFSSPIELEIPQLSNLGVDRSRFQVLKKVISSKETTISILVDSESELKETWVDAVLSSSTYVEKSYSALELESYLLFDTSNNSCGQDPNDPNWYVYRRVSDGLCIVHHGEIILGGSVAYTRRYGPTTKAECDDWEENNCGPSC